MTEFQELIKNFDRIRDYMRQFFIYGFKSRSDYGEKSARTYDNERRRIESWLSGYVQSGYTQKEKHVYISVDSKTIPQNPLYAAWKSKSFTDNDILLHFFLLDLLWEHSDGMAAGDLCNEISLHYGMAFDTQTVRLKLKEYEESEILKSKKYGKRLHYCLSPGPDSLPSQTWQNLLYAVSFFQEAAPFGFIGSTVLDRENAENKWFQFKHHFIVHTLEDGVLADLLSAIKEHRKIRFENKSSRTKQLSIISGIPLKIFVSTQTGRRYACLYLEERRRFTNFRLDSMANVTLLDVFLDFEQKQQQLQANQRQCWGVSFGGNSRREEIYLKLYLNEKTEAYIINRLYREGRGGEVLKIRENEYLYSGTFFDTNEMLGWIKSFTGRILDIQGTSSAAIKKITRDLEKMYQMYGTSQIQGEPPAKRPETTRRPNAKGVLTPSSSNTNPAKNDMKVPARHPELFDKLYGCYYLAVRRILAESKKEPITKERIMELSMKYGYLESGFVIVQKLIHGEWPLLTETPKKQFIAALIHPEPLHPANLPLTRLQKSWLKALLTDTRISLFLSVQQQTQLANWLSDTEPLYNQDHFYYFDQYSDGDDYGSPSYQEHFHTILAALQEKRALILAYENRHKTVSTFEAAPYQLQYSAKDNKFRLCCLKYTGRNFRQNTVLNLHRIKACHLSKQIAPANIASYAFCPIQRSRKPVVVQISGERNSLERCMLHFANYEKHTCYQEQTHTWLCQIYYDLADETELLIDLLSFGPVIRILGPDAFLLQIKERVIRQHHLFYGQLPEPSSWL